MTEKDMQRFFGVYLKKHPPQQNEVYELKMTSGKSIPFKAVQEHQIENLLMAERGTYYHRITDQPIYYGSNRRFTIQKPFDCLSITESRAYIVVWFYKPRQHKIFIKIRVNDFLKMREGAERKSFTEEMALETGEPISTSA